MLFEVSWVFGRGQAVEDGSFSEVYKFRREHIRENRISWCGVVKSQLQELKLEQYWLSEDIGGAKLMACVNQIADWGS